jgi:hypothetical protein
MKTKAKKKWEKPQLTSLTVQGKGGSDPFCTSGLSRVVVCNEEAGGAIGTVACNPNQKNNIFS